MSQRAYAVSLPAVAVLAAVALVAALSARAGAAGGPFVQFVFTSDAHYGLTRAAFQNGTDVDAHVVNMAMVARINSLPRTTLPNDDGVRAGQPVGPIDFLTESGDVANRSEAGGARPIQSAARSWQQFEADYLRGLAIVDGAGGRAPVFVVPGNHDASNAVGFYKPMVPPIDKTAMVEIYNLMVRPGRPMTTATYDYERDKVLASRDVGGVHFVFVTVWPDSQARAWMERDFPRVSASTPVIIFSHDQPDVEAKHFRNPNGAHDVNDRDKFENLLSDELRDGGSIDSPTTIEQAELEAFVSRHPNVAAFFHGNSNWNQFYDWTGPRHTIALHTFRVDSPMKGAQSASDQTKLSFQLATIDVSARTMTVREVLWNRHPADPAAPVAWGASATVSLAPRPLPVTR
jgi:hypothetical protein